MFTSAVDDSHSGDGDLEVHTVPCIKCSLQTLDLFFSLWQRPFLIRSVLQAPTCWYLENVRISCYIMRLHVKR